ncbi:MAG: 50S ribosomal protein L21 [Candidatus Levybacteria bacterium]|nr:50S ribosomal protein L21 [Candidatus Levybacteria bacterium]
MKYAIIRTGGKQYKVNEGDIITVERLSVKPNESVTFSEVLLYTADGTVKVGNPLVANMTVSGKVLDNVRGEKIRVSKYKAKVRYRRVHGHRQALSTVQIETIGTVGAKKAAAASEKQSTRPSASLAVARRARQAEKAVPVKKRTTKKTA